MASVSITYNLGQSIASISVLALLVVSSFTNAVEYDRSQFSFRGYKTGSIVGYYINQECVAVDIDHVVSLRDAYDNGAYLWSPQDKENFANDRDNHVVSCSHINRSKGASTPFHFLRKSSDGRGLEYEIVVFCEYVRKYFDTKRKYNLSFKNNKPEIFAGCGIPLDPIN